MSVKDAFALVFVLFFLWLSLNIGYTIIEQTQNITNRTMNSLNWSNNTTEIFQNSTNTNIENVTTMLDFFDENYLWLLISFVLILVISNAGTSLSPIGFGMFNLTLFLLIYLTANYLIPQLTSSNVTGLFANDRAENIFDFLTNNWWYLFLALFIGSVYGYIKGGSYELY